MLFPQKRREWQECALCQQEKSFSSLEVSRIEVQGATVLSIKLVIKASLLRLPHPEMEALSAIRV
jgi:hypothetical protein